MTEEPRRINKHWILALHEDQVKQHGGSKGLRDEGLLESALDRPRNIYRYDEDADLADLAAAYGHGLAKNHPFADGNKRVAFLAIYTFVRMNGGRLAASEEDVVHVMKGLASGALGEEALAAWIRDHYRTEHDE